MAIFTPQKMTSFAIDSNYMSNGRGYLFTINHHVDSISSKYQSATEEFEQDLDNVMSRWWELLTPEERSTVHVDEHRPFRGISEHKTAEEVIQAGGFTQLVRQDYFDE